MKNTKNTPYKYEPLTSSNIEVGAVVVNNNHPEWGSFRVTKYYDATIWEIGERTLFQGEFGEWSLKISLI